MKKAKKYLWKTLMGVGFVFPVFFVLTASTVKGEETTRLLSFSGIVEIQTSGGFTWEKVSSTVPLNAGDVLRTGVRSQAEITFNGGIIRMYENTLLKLPKIGMEVSRGSSEKSQQVFLDYGRAMFNIVKRTLANSFEVVTPSLIAGVKGTVFRVVEKDDAHMVTVFEGVVQVTKFGKTEEKVELVENQMARLIGGILMGPLSIDPSDRGWEDWRLVTVHQTSLQTEQDGRNRDQESVQNSETLSEDSSALSFDEKETWEIQRILDRDNDRLGDLLENSNDFKAEIQTGALSNPRISVEDKEVAIQTFTVDDRSVGTITNVTGTQGTQTTGSLPPNFLTTDSTSTILTTEGDPLSSLLNPDISTSLP